ncbi:hypothetical protein ACFCYN_23490, partial [Gottfriedia sp. NPDC056225]
MLIKYREDGLAIESNKIDEYIDYINKNNVKSLYISGMYYNLNNISFLEKCPNLEVLNIGSQFISDYSGLYGLSNIKELEITKAPIELIDFSKINSNIKRLSLILNKQIINLEYLKNLEFLSIYDFKSKNKNIDELPTFN